MKYNFCSTLYNLFFPFVQVQNQELLESKVQESLGVWSVKFHNIGEQRKDFNESKQFCIDNGSILATREQLEESYNNGGPLQDINHYGWMQISGTNKGEIVRNVGPYEFNYDEQKKKIVFYNVQLRERHEIAYCYGKKPLKFSNVI